MDAIRIYTDGSSIGNPGPGGYGVLIYEPEKSPRKLQAGYRWTTNNRMELRALLASLESLPRSGLLLEVYTDSQYVSYAIEKGWLQKWKSKSFRKVKNTDLWRTYLQLSQGHQIRIIWIRGHSGHLENERCDQMAKAAANSPTHIDMGYEQASSAHIPY